MIAELRGYGSYHNHEVSILCKIIALASGIQCWSFANISIVINIIIVIIIIMLIIGTDLVM